MPWNRKGKKEKVKLDMLNLSRTQISNLIDEWILNERDRAILKRKLLDGITFERTAEEFGMSDRQIKRIVYKLEERLFKHVG